MRFKWGKHYSCDSVTVVTALQWWQHYNCDSVSVVTALHWSQRYSGDSVTVVTALRWWQHYNCDSVTVVTALHWWQHYSGERVSLLLLSLLKKVGNARQWESKDPSPTIPTYSKKVEKGKTDDKQVARSLGQQKSIGLLLKPASPTPSNKGSERSFHRDTETGIKVRWHCEGCSEEAHKYTDVRPKQRI